MTTKGKAIITVSTLALIGGSIWLYFHFKKNKK